MLDPSLTPALRDAKLLGLLVDCPFFCGNPPQCPLHDIRKQPIERRYAWLKNRTAAQLYVIEDACDRCVEKPSSTHGRR